MTIRPFESDGFHDGDTGIINMIVNELPTTAVQLGANGMKYSSKQSIGVTQVQVEKLNSINAIKFSCYFTYMYICSTMVSVTPLFF